MPAYLQFRKNEARRERLSIAKQADGSLKVVNALGGRHRAALRGRRRGPASFEGLDIPAGAERTLAATGKKTKEGAGLSSNCKRRFRSKRLARRLLRVDRESKTSPRLSPPAAISRCWIGLRSSRRRCRTRNRNIRQRLFTASRRSHDGRQDRQPQTALRQDAGPWMIFSFEFSSGEHFSGSSGRTARAKTTAMRILATLDDPD